LLFLLSSAALLFAAVSGCTGVPAGAADTGDGVAVRFTITDAKSGQVLRQDATSSFVLGTGSSGLGLPFELAARGVLPNGTASTEYRYDPRMDYAGLVEVNRSLSPIPILQSAPRADFEQYVGPAVIGQVFPAYGIYDGVVTEVATSTVSFRIQAEDGQEDPVPSVGATLVTHVGETELTRVLQPNLGQTFAISPPSQFQPSTPLGLEPGSYKTIGATSDRLQYSISADPNHDLIGRTLQVTLTVVDVEPQPDVVPTSGNFGARASPQVNGDPATVIGGEAIPASTEPTDDGHMH
jgi:hypothetical protein